jgi:radical SAM protein with 4Fe4S-binding SPASM domain
MKRYKKIYVEITNVCNLSCSFCPKIKRSPQFMKIEVFNKILDEIKPYTDYINLHVKGEPLLHPDIDKFLDSCSDKGFKVNLTTNGTIIDKVKDKIIMKSSLRQINFSLHSFEGEKCSKEYDDYINNIISFAKEAVEKTNMIIALRLWNLTENNVINLTARKNYHITEAIEKAFDLPYKIAEKISSERGIKVYDRIYLNQDSEFEWPSLENQSYDVEGFCYALRNQAAILVDGMVIPCCLDGEGIINLGNITNMSFSEIVEGDRARSIFNGFSRREAVEELCKKCGYKRKFDI